MNRLTLVSGVGFLVVLLCCGLLAAGSNLIAAFELYALPIMPDARVDRDGRQLMLTEFGFETAVDYGVDRPPEEVAAYYRREMNKQGWNLTREQEHGLAYCLTFRKLGMFSANVEILPSLGTTTWVMLDTARYCSAFSE